MKTAKGMTAQEMGFASRKVRRAKASERFIKVRALQKQGLSAPKILASLNADGADWKIRTIYEDFKKIKQVEARAQKKIEHWFQMLENSRANRRHISFFIEQLNAHGFNIDPRVVSDDYDKLKQEIVNSIHLDIHDIL